jgi:hypothetical protein
MLCLGTRGSRIARRKQEEPRWSRQLYLSVAQEYWFVIKCRVCSRIMFSGSASIKQKECANIKKQHEAKQLGHEPTSKKIHFTLWRCAQQHVQWHRARIQFGKKTAFYFVRPPFFRSDARLLAISG